MIATALGPLLIQDTEDGPGLLTAPDLGKFMAVVNRDGALSFGLVDAPQTTILSSGMAQVRAMATRIQDAPDGPGKPTTTDNGKALAWNQSTGKFALITVNASDADTLDGHDSTYFLAAASYTAADVLTKIKTVDGSTSGLDADTLDGVDSAGFLLATGATTGATSQVQTFTNGLQVGTATAPSVVPALDILNSNGYGLIMANVITDTTTKACSFGVRHYNNAEEPMLMIRGQSTSTDNNLTYGGGSSLWNAATVVAFYSAENNTTVTGTERMRLTGRGFLSLGSTNPTTNFNITVPTAGPGTVSTVGTTTLTGSNTLFTNTFKVGDTITVSGETVRTITAIGSNSSLTVDTAFSNTASALTYTLTGGTKFDIRGNGNIGFGTASPTSRLHIAGASSAAAWGLTGILLQMAAATYTDATTASSGTATNAVISSFAQPTLAARNTSVTITNAATLYIANAPANGTNVTCTNKYALWVDDGDVRFDGNIGFFAKAPATQQTSGADLTNSVTSGGSNDTIANFTDLSTYANDAATIRNDIYQLARKLKQVNDALRLYGLLT